jgi:1-acyl-sn-glycerol-3-phosphate acyltransferase
MSLVIFPEGSRSPDGSIQPFKKGGFSLAIKSGAPIIPIAIRGSREIMPKEKLTVRPGEIQIRIGQPVETQHCALKDWKRLTEKVSQAISREFALISRE